jgi:hypothetical protein
MASPETELSLALGPLQDLATNMLRTVRPGLGGNPHLLYEQALAFIEAFETYRDRMGQSLTSEDVRRVLKLPPLIMSYENRASGKYSELCVARSEFIDEVVAASLQLAASTLTWNNSMRSRADWAIMDAMQQYQKIRRQVV